MRDNQDLLVKRLGRLVNVLESKEFGGTTTVDKDLDVTKNVTRTDEPNEDNTPDYFSTGKDRVLVPDTEEWERLGFGIVAKTVNVRTTDDVLLAFANPNTNGPTFKIRSNESPFTIGGDAGIDTAFMWLKKAESAQNDPAVEIIAYR
ncbi:head protein [Haloarcula californiae icosahedral virus 1]|uniref:VP9 n=1 Tax=Haloarcula californiae icosahedral virus 1 TaxID=1735722 RepID=A0A1C7A3R7_9VIRU|nr:head protein [Haloarcula californiae icosahedral virus 1]ALJ99690.1 VP9 [Haloarcula californiae icosahedral virus 1]6H9C_b Chain b, VP9 [Haloarcula californiae ATCC 33799]